MDLQETRILLSRWARTWEFYRSNKTCLSPDSSVSRAAMYLLQRADPSTGTEDAEVEDRSLALKVVDRIGFAAGLPEGLCGELAEIARCDSPINTILVIKCFESFLKKSLVGESEVSVIISSLVSSAKRFLENPAYRDAGMHMDQIFFTLEFSKIGNTGAEELVSLLDGVGEFVSRSLQRYQTAGMCEQHQINYALYRVLSLFMSAGGSERTEVMECIVMHLMSCLHDESKELCIGAYDKVSAFLERTPSVLKKNVRFFVQSRFLDVRAFGARCILRCLRQKTGLRKFREEIFGILYSTLQYATHRELDHKSAVSLLESLHVLNKQYSVETCMQAEKQRFRRKTLWVLRELFQCLCTPSGTGPEKEGAAGGVCPAEHQEMLKAVLTAATHLAEDMVAFHHNLDDFARDVPPPFSPNMFQADDMRTFDSIFGMSLDIFRFRGFESLIRRFYRLFVHTDPRFFSFLIKKHACAIMACAERYEILFEVWGTYLDMEKAAFLFGMHLYPCLVDSIQSRKAGATVSYEFVQRALKYLLGSKKLTANQLEKIVLTRPLIRSLDRDFQVIRILFDALRPHYGCLTAIPKVLYEKVDSFLDTLKENLERDPHNDVYVHLALNIPLSMTLVLQHFVKISYFIARALVRDGEVLKEAFNVLEASLDAVSSEVFSSLHDDVFASIVEGLLNHSKGGMFALAATQILAKFHSPMKRHLCTPKRVVCSVYPDYKIFLRSEAASVRCDGVVQSAIRIIRGEFEKKASTHVHTSTIFINTFRETLRNRFQEHVKESARDFLVSFLVCALGWTDFQAENICQKATNHLNAVVQAGGTEQRRTIPTYKSSHYARIAKRSNTDMLRYHYYVYDSLISMFQMEFYDFLKSVYDVLITFRVIERYYYEGFCTKMHFDVDFLIGGICEAFSLYDAPDCCIESDIFGGNISNVSREYVHVDHVCRIEIVPQRIVVSMFNLMRSVGLDGYRTLNCGVFDEILRNMNTHILFMDHRRQRAAVLGIASIVQICMDEDDWVRENTPSMLFSLLFYMEQCGAQYRNLVFHTILRLIGKVAECDSRSSERAEGVDAAGSGRAEDSLESAGGAPHRKDAVSQLFEKLSSPSQDLRNVALNALRYYSGLRGLDLKTVLEPHSRLFYERTSARMAGCNVYGLLDGLLFVSSHVPGLEVNRQLLSFLNISLFSNHKAAATAEMALLRMRGHFYMLKRSDPEDSVGGILENIYRYLSDPVYEDEAFIEYCRASILKLKNAKAVVEFSARLAHVCFNGLQNDKVNVVNNLNICHAFLRIFPVDFNAGMANVCIEILSDCTHEVFLKVLKILTLFPKMLDPDRIISSFKMFFGDVDDVVVAFFGRHSYVLEPLLASLDNENILELVRQMLGSKHISEFYKTRVYRVRQLLGIGNNRLAINLSLLLSYLGYNFDRAEIEYFMSKYEYCNYAEYVMFLNMNYLLLQSDHLDYIYANSPYIALGVPVLRHIYRTLYREGGSERTRHLVWKSLYMYGEKVDVLARDDLVFESNFGVGTFVGLVGDSDLSFVEASYLFFHRPTPDLLARLLFYNEMPARILDVLHRPSLDPDVFESCICDLFSLRVSYKIHLTVLIPLLISRPALITRRVLPRVLDSVHRLFGTSNMKHKIMGGQLLLAAQEAAEKSDEYTDLFAQLFSFCISTDSGELIEIYRGFNVEVRGDICLEEVDRRSLSACLVHEIRSGRSECIYERALHVLCTEMDDTVFDPSFSKYLFAFNLDFCVRCLENARSMPRTACHLLLYFFEHRSNCGHGAIDRRFALNTMEALLGVFFETRGREAGGMLAESELLLANVKLLVQKYPFERGEEFLHFLGSLASCTDEFYVFEEIISVLNDVGIDNMGFLNLALDTEGFLNLVIYIFRDDRYKEFYEELQPAFVKGLQSSVPYLRDEFHHLLDESIPRDRVDRLRYLIAFNWNLFDGNWVYTFLRLMLEGKFEIHTQRLYARGNDAFYEGVYSEHKDHTMCVLEDAARTFEHIELFKHKPMMYMHEDLLEVVLNMCFYDEETSLRLLCSYLESFVAEHRGDWIQEFESEFRGFALDLDATRTNSTAVNHFLVVFGYFLPDVRRRHNAYFSNFSNLSLEERCEIYRMVEETELYYGSFTSSLQETNMAISEFLLGRYERSQESMLKAGECFGKDHFEERESLFLKEEWKSAARRLCQWDAIHEVAALTGDRDAEAEGYLMSRGCEHGVRTRCLEDERVLREVCV